MHWRMGKTCCTLMIRDVGNHRPLPKKELMFTDRAGTLPCEQNREGSENKQFLSDGVRMPKGPQLNCVKTVKDF